MKRRDNPRESLFFCTVEAENDRTEQDPLRLLDKLSRGTDTINFALLIKRLLEFEGQVILQLIVKLWDSDDDVLIEQGVRYLNLVSDFPLSPITELAEKSNSPYVRSSLSLLLGVKGPMSVLPILWRQYHLLRSQHPKESFMQGPLYGLYEFGCIFGMLKQDNGVFDRPSIG